MRIIGDIPHARYKITLLEMSAKVSIQIEDGMLVQTYRFRDGDVVKDAFTAQQFLTQEFLTSVENTFKEMMSAQEKRSLAHRKTLEDQLPNII